MTILNLHYSEFPNDPRKWSIQQVDFHSQATLVVGRNSTGKSRLLSIIRSICGNISGLRPPAEGNYNISVKLNSGIFNYKLIANGNKVEKEELQLDGRELINRRSSESTKLFFEKEGIYIDSSFEDEILVTASRQDKMQHPWLVEFAQWAKSCRHYDFSREFSTERAISINDFARIHQHPEQLPTDKDDVVSTYTKQFRIHGKRFDDAVIADMRSLGFMINEVGAGDVATLIPGLQLDAVMLFIKEDGVPARIPQAMMSQGLFRTLGLIIQINAQALSNNNQLTLIDDIGEGLDYERSSHLIKLLIEKSRNHSWQLIMTSNDRQIMNGIPIEQWCILERVAQEVRAFTKENSRESFEEFQFTGLSNFDFFRSHAYNTPNTAD